MRRASRDPLPPSPALTAPPPSPYCWQPRTSPLLPRLSPVAAEAARVHLAQAAWDQVTRESGGVPPAGGVASAEAEGSVWCRRWRGAGAATPPHIAHDEIRQLLQGSWAAGGLSATIRNLASLEPLPAGYMTMHIGRSYQGALRGLHEAVGDVTSRPKESARVATMLGELDAVRGSSARLGAMAGLPAAPPAAPPAALASPLGGKASEGSGVGAGAEGGAKVGSAACRSARVATMLCELEAAKQAGASVAPSTTTLPPRPVAAAAQATPSSDDTPQVGAPLSRMNRNGSFASALAQAAEEGSRPAEQPREQFTLPGGRSPLSVSRHGMRRNNSSKRSLTELCDLAEDVALSGGGMRRNNSKRSLTDMAAMAEMGGMRRNNSHCMLSSDGLFDQGRANLTRSNSSMISVASMDDLQMV